MENIKLTKRELAILGIANNDLEKTLSDNEILIAKKKVENRLNRIILQGTLNILINEDNVFLDEEVIKNTIELLFDTKVIEIDKEYEYDRDYYSICTQDFSIIEIIFVDNKIYVNPFWE